MQITWDEGESANVSSETIAAMLKAGLDADEAYIGNKTGDAKAALAAPGSSWSRRATTIPSSITRPWSR